jgi:hypothetical protein
VTLETKVLRVHLE